MLALKAKSIIFSAEEGSVYMGAGRRRCRRLAELLKHAQALDA